MPNAGQTAGEGDYMAVKRMLPKNRLGRAMLKKLGYTAAVASHQAQSLWSGNRSYRNNERRPALSMVQYLLQSGGRNGGGSVNSGKRTILINGKPGDEYFGPSAEMIIRQPWSTNTLDQFDVIVR